MIVTFTGDLSITGAFTEKINTNQEIFSNTLLSSFKNSAFVITNLEGPITEIDTPLSKNTPLKSPKNSIHYLIQRNINVFNLANNHILDYGEKGFKETISTIEREKGLYFGAGLSSEVAISPIIIQKNDVSIALFGISKCQPTKIKNTQIFSADDFSTLKKQIQNIKNTVDYIIVNFHGGEEFSLFPSPPKRRFLKKIASIKEVDIVIAHHSHTFQGYEKFKKKHIFYSLGNFIFDIPNHKPYPEATNSAILRIHFKKNNFSFSFIPFKIIDGNLTDFKPEIFEKKIQQLSNFKNYKEKWQKEAFTALFRKENPYYNNILNEEKSLQNSGILSILLSKYFYKKVLLILSDRYLRSLYSSAILFKIKQKLQN